MVSVSEKRQSLRQVADLLAAALSDQGLETTVEDRGATVTWPQTNGLVGKTGIAGSSRSNDLLVTVGVLDEPTEQVALRLTEEERVNLSPSDLVRNAQLQERLEQLTPAPKEWTREPPSVNLLCADVITYGLPFVDRQSTETLLAHWERLVGADWPSETAALDLFCFWLSRREIDKAVGIYERFIEAAERPGTKRLAQARLERARALGLLDGKP